MRANVVEVHPFNIDKVKLIIMKGPKGDPGEVTESELQAVRGQVSDIYNILDFSEGSVSASGSGNQYLTYSIENGKTYIFTVNSSQNCSIATVDANNATVENVGNLMSGNSIAFTATQDAPKVLFYFRASGTGSVKSASAIDAMNDEIADLQNDLSNKYDKQWKGKTWSSYGDSISWMYGWQSQVNSLLGFDDYIRNGKPGAKISWVLDQLLTSSEGTGNKYVNFTVTAGKTYKFYSTSAANTSFATVDAQGTTIENIGASLSNSIITFTATQNASRLLTYYRAAGSAYLIPDEPTFGINSEGIYVTENPASYVKEALCSYDRISNTIDNTLPLIFVMGGTNDFLDSVPVGDLSYSASNNYDTDWFAEGGTGDYNIKTVKGAIASMFMKLHHHAPNALIVFGTLLNGVGASAGVNQFSEETNSASLKPSDYAKAEKEVCEIFGIPCVDVFGTCGINVTNRATYISDTVHPNTSGLELLSRCVASGLEDLLPRF